MLKGLKSFLAKDRVVTGIELILQADESVKVRCCTLRISGGMITLKGKWEARCLEELAQKLDKQIPVVLSLDGRSILHKQVNLSSPTEQMNSQLLAAVLPALEISKFYIQAYRASSAGYFSMARRETVDTVLSKIRQLGLRVIHLVFGPFAIAGISAFLPGDEDRNHLLELENCQLELNTRGIASYRSTPTERANNKIKIGNEELEQHFVVAYAAAFTGIVAKPEGLTMWEDPLEEVFEDHVQRKLFRLGLTVVLVFFFLLLLCNFFVFNFLSEKHVNLQAQLEYNRNNLKELGILERKVKEQRSFLQATGWLGNTKLSFYADRVVATMPKDIRLTELSIHPYAQGRSKKESKQVFELGTLAVYGACQNPIILNSWIKLLNQQDWVVRVERQNYIFDHAKGEGIFEFHIQLNGYR